MAFLRAVKMKDYCLDLEDETDDVNYWDDFEAIGEDEPVEDVVSLFKESGHEFSPYTIDWARETVLFARTKAGVDLKEHFYLQLAQREFIKELLSVPLAQLHELVDAVAEDVASVENIFLFYTSRCGSTLVVKATNALPTAMAVDEPDIYSVIAMAYEKAQEGENPIDAEKIPDVLLKKESVVALVKNFTVLFNYYFLRNDEKERSTILYKLKPHMMTFGEVMGEAHPEASTIFLYRNGLETVESTVRVQYAGYKKEYQHWVKCMKRGRSRHEDMVDLLPDHYVLFGDDPKLETPPEQAHQLYYLTCLWQGIMQEALEHQKDDPEYFFTAVVNYKALVDRKEEAFLEVMERVGIKVDLDDTKHREALAQVFCKDSQAESVLSIRTEDEWENWKPCTDVWFGEWEKGVFDEVCQRTKLDITDPAFVFPNTMF